MDTHDDRDHDMDELLDEDGTVRERKDAEEQEMLNREDEDFHYIIGYRHDRCAEASLRRRPTARRSSSRG